MKFLQKVASLPQELEANVLYLNSTDGSVAVKPTPKVPEGYVDLGLSVYWAKCNVGATTETDYGKLFQWGATEGHDYDTDAKDYSTWSTAPFNNESSDYDKTYFASVKDKVCPNGVLAAQYDAASVATDGVAHMPTQDDFKELTANTTVEWVTDFNGSGVNGRKFTNKTDATKYIFIPASGGAGNGSVYGRDSYGSVWSSSLYASSPNSALRLSFNGDSMDVSSNYRYGEFSVRGVVSK